MPNGRASTSPPDLADKLEITVPADRQILADVEKFRTELIDTALEQDDEAMEAYLTDGKAPSFEVLQKCLRKGTVASAFNLVLCGSSLQEQGRATGVGCRCRLPAGSDRR